MLTTEQRTKAKVQLASFEVRSAEQARARLMEQHDSASRWLVASLFAINGGAILAILNSDKTDPTDLIFAIWVYFVGLLLSFAMAVALQISDRRIVAAVHSWGLYWSSFLETMASDEAAEANAKDAIASAERIGKIGRNLGLASMAFFSVGTVYMIGFYTGTGDAKDELTAEAQK